LASFCQQSGIELKRNGSTALVAICPLHLEKSESFYVYPDGHYHCYGCGSHGDIIDLCAAINSISKLEAAEKITGGFAPVIFRHSEKTFRAPYVLTDEDNSRMRHACDRLAADQKLIERLCATRPEWTADAVKSVALSGDLGFEDDCRFSEFSGPALLFRYSHGLKARWKSLKGKKRIRWITGAANGQCWRQSGMGQGHKIVFITEGESDCLTGVSMGLENTQRFVLGLAGANILPKPDPFKDRHVICIPDPDEQGRDCARKLQTLLEPLARKFSIFHVEELYGQ
jgi:hypothetical protein